MNRDRWKVKRTPLGNPKTKRKKGKNSRSSSSKHLSPFRLSRHTQRQTEAQSKHQNDDDFSRSGVLVSEEEDDDGGEQERDGEHGHDDANKDVDAVFVVEEQVGIGGHGALFGVGEDELSWKLSECGCSVELGNVR